MATIAELITRVRNKTLVSAAEMTDTTLLYYFTDCQYDIAWRFDWPFLQDVDSITVVAGTMGYAIASNVDHIVAVIDLDTRHRLQGISATQAFTRWGDDFPSGSRARYFFIWNDQYNLVPVPDAGEAGAYLVYHTTLPTEFTATTDSPPFKATYHHIMAAYVEARVWERFEDFEKAMAAQARYEQGVRAMRLDYADQFDQSPWAVGDGVPNLLTSNTPFLDTP